MPSAPTSATFAVLALLAAGCNAITGADGLVIAPLEREPDEGSGGQSATAGPAGAGGAATGAAAGTTTGVTGSTATSTGSGPACPPAVGPYGAMLGDTIAPSQSWQGYPDQSAQSGTLSMADYYDCDGSKGIHAILIDQSATWCGPCQEEATDIVQHEAAWEAKGIRVITLMVEDASANPATLSTATQWKQNFGLTTAVGADPDFSFAGNVSSIGLPLQLVVDPRTFEIVDRQEGYSGSYSVVESLAAQNAN